MGRQAVAERYRRTSGAHLHTHLTTLVICQIGRKISGPAVTDLRCRLAVVDASRDVGAKASSLRQTPAALPLWKSQQREEQ
jgi:hypothetical protein